MSPPSPLFPPPITRCSRCAFGKNPRVRCPLTPATLPAGARLCAEGETFESLHLIREGLAAAASVGADGRSEPGELYGPSSLLGTEALQGHSSYDEVRALTELAVCSLAVSRCKTLLEELPSFSGPLTDALVDEAWRTKLRMQLRRGSALSRVARLLALGAPLEVSPRGLSKKTLASVLDVRPETLSRCLRHLRDRGLVAGSHSIRVLDPPRLLAVARVDGGEEG